MEEAPQSGETLYSQTVIEELLIEILDELLPHLRTDHMELVRKTLIAIGWSDTHIALYLEGELY